MRALLCLAAAATVGVGVLTFASAASAQDAGTVSPGAVMAYYCGDAEMRCMRAPIAFHQTKQLLPISLDWDTGWIPQNFDQLQVRFFVKIPNDTTLEMAGRFQANWPPAITITTPGDRSSGLLKFDYGLMVGAEGKIDVSVLGYHVTWQGDLPYFPQVDFHLLGMNQFDAWSFPPNSVAASAFTAQVQLFEVNVLELANIPSQVAEGGVRLSLKGELRATYNTEKMVITPSVVPITTENGATLHNYIGGPYVEYDVHPEGQVHYEGFIHFIPSFFITVLGHDFNMPFYDYPLELSSLLGQNFITEFVFDPVTVHVPLPDVPALENPVLDFGQVQTGSGQKLPIALTNQGEAKARLVAQLDPAQKGFKVLSSVAEIDPGANGEIEIRFVPKTPGPYSVQLTLQSNDPDLPTQTVELKGEAVGEPMPEDPSDPDSGTGGSAGGSPSGGGAVWDGSGENSGCGCHSAPHPVGGWLGFSLCALAAFGAARRRASLQSKDH